MATTKTSLKNQIRNPNKRLPKGPHGGIELLLIQPVEHLGKQGDVVEVKRGLRRELSYSPRPGHHRHRSPQAHGREASGATGSHREGPLVGLQSLAADLARQSITIEANANDEGHLYGSVNAVDVSNALKRCRFPHRHRPGPPERPAEGTWASTPSRSTSARASTPK